MALIAVLAVFTGSVALQIASGTPFEYDEASYAVQARAWSVGGPTTGVELRRAPLVPALDVGLARGATTEWPHRLFGLGFGLAFVLATWALGRLAAGDGVGVAAGAVVAADPHLLQRSAQFLTDVPAATLLLAATIVVWRETVAGEPTWRLSLAGAAAAGSIYVRYGSALPVALLLVAGAFLWRTRARASLRPALAAVAAFAVLMIPHVVRAIDATGRPWGLVTSTATSARQAAVGGGLVGYLRWLPFYLAGFPAAVAIVAAAVGAVRGRTPAPLRLLGALGIADIVAIGVAAHAEARFVLFPVAILAVAGCATLTPLLRATRVRAIVVLALAAGLVVSTSVAGVRTDHGGRARGVVREAALELRARAGGRPCSVLSIQVPVVTWYSGCAAVSPQDPMRPLAAEAMFVVTFDGPRGGAGTPVNPCVRAPSRAVATIEGDPRSFGNATIAQLDASGCG